MARGATCFLCQEWVHQHSGLHPTGDGILASQNGVFDLDTKMLKVFKNIDYIQNYMYICMYIYIFTYVILIDIVYVWYFILRHTDHFSSLLPFCCLNHKFEITRLYVFY